MINQFTVCPIVELKGGGKGIDKTHTFQRTIGVKVFAENKGDLVESGRGPDLRIIIGQRVVAHTARRFDDNLRGQVDDGPHHP